MVVAIVCNSELVAMLNHVGRGKVLLQSAAHTNGAASWTTASMWRRECLVEIDVHNVKSHISRAACTEHGIEVGSIVVHQCTAVVYQFRNLRYLCFKKTKCVRISHHHSCDVVTQQRLEVFHVNHAFGSTLDFHNLQSAYSC